MCFEHAFLPWFAWFARWFMIGGRKQLLLGAWLTNDHIFLQWWHAVYPASSHWLAEALPLSLL